MGQSTSHTFDRAILEDALLKKLAQSEIPESKGAIGIIYGQYAPKLHRAVSLKIKNADVAKQVVFTIFFLLWKIRTDLNFQHGITARIFFRECLSTVPMCDPNLQERCMEYILQHSNLTTTEITFREIRTSFKGYLNRLHGPKDSNKVTYLQYVAQNYVEADQLFWKIFHVLDLRH